MKVAVIQMNAGSDINKNLSVALRLIEKSVRNQAKFICLPEMFCFRSKMSLKGLKKDVAQELDGSILETICTLAKKHVVYILAGSIYEKTKKHTKLFNASVIFDPQGKKIATYRKINLFEAIINSRRISESKNFEKGCKKVTAQIGAFKAGLSICYDLRFSPLFEFYKKQEVEILCVPSSFTKRTGQAHWEVLCRARAIENRSYVLAPNQIGGDGTVVEAYGHSMIVSPWGEVLARAKNRNEDVIYAEVSKRELRKVKEALPL